jgi:hypothetical protein
MDTIAVYVLPGLSNRGDRTKGGNGEEEKIGNMEKGEGWVKSGKGK